MHTAYIVPLLVASGFARTLPLVERGKGTCATGCSFTLSVKGESVYENPTDAHQVAYGGSNPGEAVTFCIDSAGKITDEAGHCGITQQSEQKGKTSQFQCDATMTSTFTISCEGYLEYMGSSKFYACLASESIGYNFYATPPTKEECASGTPKEIQLMASGCHAQCEDNGGNGGCPGNLEGDFQYPHLIIPVSKSSPNTAYRTSYNGQVTLDISTIFNFDVPQSSAGKMCKVVFDFPDQKQLDTSSYTLTGDGMVNFCMLSSAVTESTTYANKPKAAMELHAQKLSPHNSYHIWEGKCPAGTAVAFEMSTTSDTTLWYFQDYNPCPIGLYMLVSN